MIQANKKTIKDFGFMRVASIVPQVSVGNVEMNKEIILQKIKEATQKDAALIVFPELSITGYTLGDLFHQEILQQEALKALYDIREDSKKHRSLVVVGLPFLINGALFNVAALLSRGIIIGIVPKSYLPNYKEFYEARWFAPSRDLSVKDIDLFGERVPVGNDLLFRFFHMPGFVLGIEICEDLWTPLPQSSFQAVGGATVLVNLSASNEVVGKSEYRRELVTQQSARTFSAYLYTSSGVGESTTDLVYSGHALIAETGILMAESKRFERKGEELYADIDIQHLVLNREQTGSFAKSVHALDDRKFRFIDFKEELASPTRLNRFVDENPFVPGNPEERDKRAQEIFSIQTAGLAKRLEYAHLDSSIIGLSGGLDSALALLVAVEAHALLGLPTKNIYAFSMPGFGTSDRTKKNAKKLAEHLEVQLEEIDITRGSNQQFRDIQHNGKTQDVTFENVQARYRTMILMNKSNQIGGLVVGTGDMSELALGWNTFSGDHISHYNVNAGIPKTLVKYLIQWVSEREDFKHTQSVLQDILDTPISPELTRKGKGGITQKTEDLIGPYQLHDFFLYHFVRWGSSPVKILFLAEQAFGKKYSRATLKKYLRIFIKRFFKNQWKRSVMPDGPKIGSVSLSPRGDWRMPSDAEVDLWLRDIK